MAFNFGLGKPRRFHHTFIYYDERKERLRQLEQRAKAELGLDEARRDCRPEDLRGTFLAADSHVRRHRGLAVGNALMVVLILLCVLLLILML